MLTFCRLVAQRAAVRSHAVHRSINSIEHSSRSVSSTTSSYHDYLAVESQTEDSKISEQKLSKPLEEIASELSVRRAFRMGLGRETVIPVSFGVIRLDSQNKPFIHSQLERGTWDETHELNQNDLHEGHSAVREEQHNEDNFGRISVATDSLEQNLAEHSDRSKESLYSSLRRSERNTSSSTSHEGGWKPLDKTPSKNSLPKYVDLNNSGASRKQGTSLSPLDLGIIDEQYFSDASLDTRRSSESTRSVYTGCLSEAPGDVFEEQYFEQAFSESHTRLKGDGDECLPSSSHVSREKYPGKTKTSTVLGKVPGQPQDVFEEQYFYNAFEESGEKEQIVDFKSRLLAEHAPKIPPIHSTENGNVPQMSENKRELNERKFGNRSLSTTFEVCGWETVDKSGIKNKSEIASSSVAVPRKSVVEQSLSVSSKETLAVPSKQRTKKAARDSDTESIGCPSGQSPVTSTQSRKLSALDVVTEMRKEQERGKTAKNRGKMIRDETPQVWKLPSYSVLSMLKKTMILNNENLVVLNKPFGLSMHDTSSRSPHRLVDFLPELAKSLCCDRLFTVHRLDKDTTGVLLLAKNPETAAKIQELFHDREVRKTYWAITVGVPKHPAGVIDMVLQQKKTNVPGNSSEMERMQPLAEGGDCTNSSPGQRAITHYRTLSTSNNCALVELKPTTGVKHQLRCQLGLGLGCPILGDHKYSRWDKVVPQKLPSGILQLLKLRQPEARYLPMCLHSRMVWFPGMDRAATAPLPHAFRKMLRRLKLRRT